STSIFAGRRGGVTATSRNPGGKQPAAAIALRRRGAFVTIATTWTFAQAQPVCLAAGLGPARAASYAGTTRPCPAWHPARAGPRPAAKPGRDNVDHDCGT